MIDILKDAIIDSIKLLPFLFIVYLIMEFIEHKSTNKTEKIIKNSGKFGPIIGSIFGAFPQCGFSVMASNLYIANIISMGTLVAIYLSTSDEMLPILISNGTNINVIIKFLLLKVVIGMIFGLILDLIINRKNKNLKKEIGKLCNDEHCHCDENILLSSLKHTINIFIFILVINIIMNSIINIVGENSIKVFLTSNHFIGPILSSLIGLIPNCAASVIITELFLSGSLSFGSALAGLLASSGLGILVLFKMNKNIKENFSILLLIYFISAFVGILFNLLNIVI